MLHPAGTRPPSFGEADITPYGYTQMLLLDVSAFGGREKGAIGNIYSLFSFNCGELTFITCTLCFGTGFMARIEPRVYTGM